MLENFIKIAFRRLKRNKVFTMLNVLGLSTGLCAFAFITHYVSFETSYDQFHRNGKYIYRIGSERYSGDELMETSAMTFPGIRSLLKDNFPEVKDVTGFYKTPANTGFLFRKDGMIYNESGGWLNADSAFFEVFPTLLASGDHASVLDAPNNVVISETLAGKLFGDADPVGQTLDRIDDYATGDRYTVSGVLKDIPRNAHFHATIIEHIHDKWPESDVELWGEGRLVTYVSFSNDIRPDRIEAKLNTLLKDVAKTNPHVRGYAVFLQPVTGIHLNSDSKDELEVGGSKAFLYFLGAIGVAILVMAWINYINLETAAFVHRIREYGIRRMVGSGKHALVSQFLTEYFVLTVVSLLLAVAMMFGLSQAYEALAGIPFDVAGSPVIWAAAIGFFLFGSVVVGAYPSMFFIRFDPVRSLKGYGGGKRSGTWTRKWLVVVQFASSSTLIALVMTADKQLEFMRAQDKGVELETVIAIRNPTAYSDQQLTEKHGEFERIANRLVQSATVRSVASSSAIPGTEIGFNYIDRIKRNMGDPYDPTPFKTMFVSSGFIPTYNLTLLAGSNFSVPGNYAGDAPWEMQNWATVVLNEEAIRQLGFHSAVEAVDQEVYFQPFDDVMKCRIIGVVGDYHHEAVKKDVFPTIFFHNYGTYQQVYYSIGLHRGVDIREALLQIQSVWKESFPDKPFEYFFMDDYYQQQFMSEVRFRRVIIVFGCIAVWVACLGVLGMSIFEMNRRLKEIAIRKTLGATVAGLAVLLSRTNIALVVASGVIATPLIGYLAEGWLSQYPARIGVSPAIAFMPLGIVAAMVAVVSGVLTVRAALANPVEHLKRE